MAESPDIQPSESLRVLDERLYPAPWPTDWLYEVVRHGDRNMEIESHEMPEWGGPNRHDGTPLARLRNLVPGLLAEIDRLRLNPPEGWGWSRHMTPDGRVFLPRGNGYVMAKIHTDDHGFAVQYVRGEDGGFRETVNNTSGLDPSEVGSGGEPNHV